MKWPFLRECLELYWNATREPVECVYNVPGMKVKAGTLIYNFQVFVLGATL